MLDKIVAVSQKLGPGLRQAISNIVWLFADKIIQMGLSLVVGIWVARYLGPTQFGTLNYALTFVSMCNAFTGFGAVGTLVVRDIAREPACKNASLGTAFALQLIGGIGTVLVAIATIYLLNPHETLLHWLVGILAAGTLFNAFNAIEFWFQSQVQSKYTVFARNSAYVFMCAVRLVLIQLKASLIDFAWARLAEMALGALGLVVAYRLQGNPIQAWRFSLRRTKELLQESWPMLLSGVAVYMYANIDQVMLGSMLPEKKSELGFYAAAVKISNLFDFLPMILTSSIFPKLSQLKAKSNEDYLQKLQIYFDLSTVMWLAMAVPVSILSPYIVHTLYGANFAATAPLLSLYVWSQFSSYLGVARNTFLVIEGKLSYTLILSVSGAFLNILLNYFLIPNYGAMGATVASLITYFIVIILLNFYFKELRFVGMLILRSLNLYKVALRIRGLVI
jgi:PST family polysaccharide transporter